MAQMRVCSKCTKPVLKNQKAFKTDSGDIIHGACYNCDQCSANMLGKRVGSVPGDDGKSFMKVCWECMKKHPHYSILFSGQSSEPEKVPQKIMICKQCKENIVGKSYKTKLGGHFHEKCYTCDRCKESLAGKAYGYFKQQKWCNSCLNKRSGGIGDIVTSPSEQYSAAKAYQETMTKLKTNKKGMVEKMAKRSNEGRLCTHCKQKIAGPGVTIQRDNGKMEYHRYCLYCDDCKKKVSFSHVKIIKDKMLCAGCVGNWTTAVVK